MLFVVSPAKALDYDTPAPTSQHSAPLFVPQSQALIQILREKSPQQIADLMHLSDKLASLNVGRYAAWQPKSDSSNAKQAVFAFDGDVYAGLDAHHLTAAQINWLQEHLCILSGLYGVLRPLDWMQPYRLEMGTPLNNPKGKDLYAFWGTQIADYLNTRLAEHPVLVNLASTEYFKSVDKKALKARVVDCVFQDYKNGQYKIISFYAKRARGLMVRYAATHAVQSVDGLKGFDLDGYHFVETESNADKLVFRRKQEA